MNASITATTSWVDSEQAGVKVPDSKVHGANMGPTWGRQDPGGPHVGPMNLLSGVTPAVD